MRTSHRILLVESDERLRPPVEFADPVPGEMLVSVSMVRHPLSSRFLQAMILGYVLLAIFTRMQEARGVYTCGCDEDCWCKRPGLSLFRWVLPRWHKNEAIAAWKASQA